MNESDYDTKYGVAQTGDFVIGDVQWNELERLYTVLSNSSTNDRLAKEDCNKRLAIIKSRNDNKVTSAQFIAEMQNWVSTNCKKFEM